MKGVTKVLRVVSEYFFMEVKRFVIDDNLRGFVEAFSGVSSSVVVKYCALIRINDWGILRAWDVGRDGRNRMKGDRG